MKNFKYPTIEVEEFSIEDVITSSNCETEGVSCENDGGIFSLR